MSYDVIVVGGGPSGLIAAHRIAKDGHRVLLLEEHKQIGIPDHCAGLISSSGLRKLGLHPPANIIENAVRGARIHAPSNHSLTIERGKKEALVVNRQAFDKWLAERAQDAGVEIRTDSPVRDVSRRDGRYRIQTGEGETSFVQEARVVVNAEGSRGVIARKLGLSQVPKSSKLPAYQYEVRDISLEPDFVEMFYGHQVSQGFFAWIIPLGEKRARVGIASRNQAKLRLKSLMRSHPVISQRVRGMRVERGFGGIVLVGLPVTTTSAQGAMNVGDAAGVVKATTGGGIVVGGTMAQLAGKFISDALRTQDGPIDLQGFDNRWRSVLLRELQAMFLAQKLLTSLSDSGLDLMVEGANRYGLLEIVKKKGDMDMQKTVILRLLRDPRMMLLGLQAICHINPFRQL